MSPISITTLVSASLMALLQLQIAASAPQKRGASLPTATMVSMVEDKVNHPQCVPFYHPYCNSFDYYYALFPNPRQIDLSIELGRTPTIEDYIANAQSEFFQFTKVMDTGCSQKLGTFLCFLYFPFCSSQLVVRPCKSLCEEVTRDCAETVIDALNLVLGRNDSKLPDQFNCSNYEFNNEKVFKEDKCANNYQMPWYPLHPTVKEIMEEPTETITTETPTTETPITTEVPTTLAPTTSAPTCSLACKEVDCRGCNIRSGANGNTFAKNEDYNFVFKVTMNSFTTYHCKQAVNFTVHEQYHLKSSKDCSVAPEIQPGSTILGVGADLSCENCFIQLREDHQYLVAGIVRTAEDGCVYWEFGPGKSESLIVEWNGNKFAHPKKRNKRVEAFVAKGNDGRGCS